MVYLQTRFQLYLIIIFSLLLTGCNADWLTVTSQVLAAQAQIGQRDGMPKANRHGQTSMANTLDGFTRFESRAHRLAFDYPSDWGVDSNVEDDRFIILLTQDPTLIESDDPDFQQPFVFMIAGIRQLYPDEIQPDPVDIQAEFLTDFTLDMNPLTDLKVTETQNMVEISQDFYATDNDSADMEITITTLIKDNRTITSLYGGNEIGLAQYGEALFATAKSMDVLDISQLVLESDSVDFSDPVSVVDAIFIAAVTEDYDLLAGLCDPWQENDEDTAVVCEIHAGHQYIQEFAEYFTTGQVTGEATIFGDEAEVPFVFGPDGDEEETMNLIMRDGKWYLSSF